LITHVELDYITNLLFIKCLWKSDTCEMLYNY